MTYVVNTPLCNIDYRVGLKDNDVNSITRPDYLNYSRLIAMPIATAIKLLANAQLENEEIVNPAEYNQKLQEKIAQLEIIVKNAIHFSDLEYIDNGDGTTTEDGEIFYELQLLHVYVPDFCEWAFEKHYDLPEEFKALVEAESANDPSQAKSEKMPRASNIAKIKCQAIAKTLWFQNPEMKAVEIINHPAILEFGDGKNYMGKNTLLDWIREFDPRPQEKKTGPKK